MMSGYLFVLFSCCAVLCLGYETGPPLTCGANEEPKCVKECPPETTCRNRGILVSCLDDGKPCQQKCVCKEGYFRNVKGNCITEAQCDQCSGDHEYFDCDVACDNVCTDMYRQSKDNCPIVNIKCNDKCYCDDGHARTKNGTCVPIEECPTPTCGDNEVVDTCPVDCPTDYCPANDEQAKTKSCPKPDKCPPATCKCGFNSRRAENETCIPTRECPSFDCPGENEEYNSCPAICPGEQCSQATADGECHSIGRIGIVLQCFPRCHCIKNFWRRDGKCVPYDECRNCPANEKFIDDKKSCPPENCSSFVAKFKCDSNETPFSGCVCEDGYRRNKTSTDPCMPQCECSEIANSEMCKNV